MQTIIGLLSIPVMCSRDDKDSVNFLVNSEEIVVLQASSGGHEKLLYLSCMAYPIPIVVMSFPAWLIQIMSHDN